MESNEYITALSAYGKTLSTQDVITALTFTTNKRTYGPYGNKSGFQISAPEATGKQIAGFLGTSGNVLNSIDVHYAPIPTGTGSGTGSGTGTESGTGTGTGTGTGSGTGTGTETGTGTPSAPVKKLQAEGGDTGAVWDDGPHDNVKKVYVGQGQDGVGAVKFEYMNGSQVVFGNEHGKSTMLGFEEVR